MSNTRLGGKMSLRPAAGSIRTTEALVTRARDYAAVVDHGTLVEMNTGFSNVYDDKARAEAYAVLEFPGTYYLAYRDLPALLRAHVRGTNALDFGCGAGRSTRFLRGLGFDVVGVDISDPMLAQARERDPGGVYRLVSDDALTGRATNTWDVVLSAFIAPCDLRPGRR